MLHSFDVWRQTTAGLIILAVVDLLLAYGFASLAIDSGNLFYYLITLIAFAGFSYRSIKVVFIKSRRK